MKLPDDARTFAVIDTETTGLGPDRRAWDIAVIVLDLHKRDSAGRLAVVGAPWQAYVEARDLDLGNAEPAALEIGRFYDRHPSYTGRNAGACLREAGAMRTVQMMTAGCSIVGAVPSFDMEVLGNRMRANGLQPRWHHRPVDVELICAVMLDELPGRRSLGGCGEAFGFSIAPEERHTATGDAKLARRLFELYLDKIIDEEQVAPTERDAKPEPLL